jgi:hypothetical protein
VLKSEKGILLPSLENALMRYFEEHKSVSVELEPVGNN